VELQRLFSIFPFDDLTAILSNSEVEIEDDKKSLLLSHKRHCGDRIRRIRENKVKEMRGFAAKHGGQVEMEIVRRFVRLSGSVPSSMAIMMRTVVRLDREKKVGKDRPNRATFTKIQDEELEGLRKVYEGGAEL